MFKWLKYNYAWWVWVFKRQDYVLMRDADKLGATKAVRDLNIELRKNRFDFINPEPKIEDFK